MAESPGRRRLLTAVAARARADGAVPVEVAVDLARTAVRRLGEDELRRADTGRLAEHLVAGATLLAERRDPTAVRVVPLEGGTLIQLATEDRTFLLSTVLDELEDDGHHVRSRLHPVVGTVRDDDGRLLAVQPARDAPHREALIHVLVGPRLDAAAVAAMPARLERLVDDVRATTDGYTAMRDALRTHASRLRERSPDPPDAGAGAGDPADDPADDPASDPADDPADDAHEVADLLDWLLDDHAVLLGVRRYRLLDADGIPLERGGGDASHLELDPDVSLGLLGDATTSRFAAPTPLEEVAATRVGRPGDLPALTWSRTRRRSSVQRRVRMEHLVLAERDASGRTVAVLRSMLLFTRQGEAARAETTPVLRRRLTAVLESEDVVVGSYDELAITDLFQALPKDELLPLDGASVRGLVMELLHAEEHREVRAWHRIDRVARTVSVVVAVPRDTYSPQLRDRLREHLRLRFDADRIDLAVALGDGGEAIARYLLTLEHDVHAVPADELEDEVRQLARDWTSEVRELLLTRDGADEADRLTTGLARRLPRSYREAVDPARAASDLRLLDRALGAVDALTIGWQRDEAPRRWRLRVVVHGRPLELSAFLPMVESLGLTVVDELPHQLTGDEPLHLHDLGVRAPSTIDRRLSDTAARTRASATLQAEWRGHAEVDNLGQLVILAELTWRDVGILRAYRRYRRQLGTAYTPAYVEEILVVHAAATAALLGRFHARHDPRLTGDRGEAMAAADATFETAMQAVTRLDADRVLRGLSSLVDATTRTNAFRRDAVAEGDGAPYVALKLDPSRIAEVPAPVPYREVFVHSPSVEGVHLRAGPVARGGLRWSDRRDDVRTEVLGLVKAQVLKNALIVPTGAKGGFVLTRPPADPDALRDEVTRQYVTFIRALLDVTDDLRITSDGAREVVPPPDVVRHDADDPYLVVAADKGTARLSDTANGVAVRAGFWLGDAFASGGSAGYDHKALGVTAKGAWRAVARHFHELGVDVASEPITVAGVGDLSGDVFSNGLLRSRAVKLVAAFDHRHVFVDPDPDLERSFAERERVAALPRSSWDDYDRSALSPGGFIVPRDVRSVALTPEAREALRLEAHDVSPPELMRAILSAPVDLLWAGGIGTYIKATEERHEDVGDRANDEVRVDATAVRARVIGEGANLFVTQRARIELSRRGARVDQDAIHNAAGVATSDAEVNLKILLDLAIADGRLDAADRDAVLAGFAEEVVAGVLDAVDRQVAALSAEVDRSTDQLEDLDAFVSRLEDRGELDREVEILPSSVELAARAEAGGGLTRPELATLLAWAKRELKESLLASDAPDDPVLSDAVTDGFPPAAVALFGDLLPHHHLRRELVATAVANTTVDRLGITFASGLADETGRALPLVVRAIRVATAAVDAPHWWAAIEALSGTLAPERTRELAGTLDTLVRDLAAGLLRDPLLAHDPVHVLARDRAAAAALLEHGFAIGSDTQRRARRSYARWLVDDLLEPDMARLLACAPDLAAVPDVSTIVTELGGDRGDGEVPAAVAVADVLFRTAEVLGIEALRGHLTRVPTGDGWARRQRRGVAEDLRAARRDAALAALRQAPPGTDPERVVAGFVSDHREALDRVRRVVAQVTGASADLDAVAVAVRELRDAVQH